MIPAPGYRSSDGCCRWSLSAGSSLWWFPSGHWELTVDAHDDIMRASISIDLGREAPAALLLLAHQQRTP